MKLSVFLKFVAPSLLMMLVLILVPLVGTGWLALHQERIETKTIKTVIETPLFGGKVRKTEKVTVQPILDEQGQPIHHYKYVGLQNFSHVLEPDKLSKAWDNSFNSQLSFLESISNFYQEVTKIEFWGALEFTLLYVFTTLPFILIIGFMVAWSVNTMYQRYRAVFSFISLLPFIITPVVGALSIYWLFLDDAIVSALLERMGAEQFYFLSDKLSIRFLIIGYGVWHSVPFAFVVLFAGLQSVPSETMDAARIDGASTLEQIRYVVIPHLLPLFIFITLIHVMDAYRVFEPILVFGSALFADSLQHLTYAIIVNETNYTKASASALLTVVGIVILLIPVIWRTWHEQKGIVS